MKFSFKSKSIEFKPKAIPLLSFIVSLAILLTLSSWQFKRLKWKENLIQIRTGNYEIPPRSLKEFKKPAQNEFRKIIIKGKLLNDKEMFMPALSKNGNNGFHILVPLKTAQNKYYIYDTGWIPLKIKDKKNRLNYLFENEQEFNAVIRTPGRKGYFQPENDLNQNVWFFVEPKIMSNYLDVNFEEDIYLEALDTGPNGFPIGNQTRIYLRNNHLQYALTWLFLSFGLIGVFMFSNIRVIKK